MINLPVERQVLDGLRLRIERVAAQADEERRLALTEEAARLTRPPRIAIIGALDEGTPTLVKLLLRDGQGLRGEPLLSEAVPTLLRYASRPHGCLVTKSGESNSVSLERLGQMVRAGDEGADLKRIEVALPMDRLRAMELLVAPPSALAADDAGVTAALRNVDSCVWCGPAMPGWRSGDQKLWDSVDPAVRRRGILVFNRAEGLATEPTPPEADSVAQAERSGQFMVVIAVSLSDAIVSPGDGTSRERLRWLRTGYPAFEKTLEAVAQSHLRRHTHRQVVKVLRMLREFASELS